MVLKINNNLITPSHIIEGEKVNDTYFEGKYHLMLPNSEERFLTSVSERKQLLNESLRSNLYDRKTRGTIVNNTTTGKMFDITETQTTLVTGENFADYNYVVLPSFNPGSQSWKMHYKINTKDRAGYDNSIFGQLTDARSIIVKVKNNRFTMYASSGSGWNIANGKSGSYSVQNNTDYVIEVTFDGSKYVLSYSLDDGKTFTEDIVINNSNPIYADSENRLGRAGASGEYFRGKIYLSECYIKIGNDYYFNGASMRKADYTVYGNPTITEETITIRTVTQKPFTQSVTINSSEIQEGTKYLVDYPGMFQIKTEDNTFAVKFLFEDEPVWKYIKKEELVEGNNVLSLVSDTEKLKFIVNTTEHVLIDSTETEEVKTIKNFSTSNGFYFANLFPNYSSFKLITEVKTPSAQGDHSVIFAKRNDAENYFALRYGNIPSFYLGGWTQGTQDLEYNKYYWFCLNSENDSLVLYTLLDNKYSIESLPALTNWTRQCSVSNNFISGYNFALGYNTVTPGEYYKGEIVLSDTKIYIDENTYFDGKTAVQGVDYTVIGSPTIETETIHIGGEIPELTAGYLGYREGWKLKQGE